MYVLKSKHDGYKDLSKQACLQSVLMGNKAGTAQYTIL